MRYFIKRGTEEYGPYSLADLQRYVGQGNIQLTDLARGEELAEWVPVERVIGNVPVPPPPAAQPNYGQIPVYGAAAPPGIPVAAGPLPPGLHWAIVLIAALVTCGMFNIVWMFVQAVFVSKLSGGGKALLFYGVGIPLLLGGQLFQASRDPSTPAIAALLVLVGIVLVVAGHFQIKSTLEEHYNTVEPINLHLNGVMVLFLNVLYFQYHFTRIRNWKLTGTLL